MNLFETRMQALTELEGALKAEASILLVEVKAVNSLVVVDEEAADEVAIRSEVWRGKGQDLFSLR